MVRTTWWLRVTALALTVMVVGRLGAQELPPAPEPITVTTLPHPQEMAANLDATAPVIYSADSSPAPVCAAPPPPGTGIVGVGPPACTPYEDCNGPVLDGDPLLDPPCYPHPGWFAALELGVVGPHVNNQLVGPVAIGNRVDQVRVPTADLDWTGMPRLEVGYRFSKGAGEILFSYRDFETEGREITPNFDPFGNGALRSRLCGGYFDLDYANREFGLGPLWDMKWKVGLRAGGSCFETVELGTVAARRISNHFGGLGPNAGLDLWRRFPNCPFGIFTRLEGAVMLGRVHQEFEEAALTADGMSVLTGITPFNLKMAVPMVNFQAGLGWTPSWKGRPVRFAAGYQVEGWFYVGELITFSRADFIVQGPFVRAEWNY